MKKIFLLLVTALFLLSLYGCNTSSSSNNPTEQTTVTNTDDLSLDSDTDSETEFNNDLEIYYNDKKIDNAPVVDKNGKVIGFLDKDNLIEFIALIDKK